MTPEIVPFFTTLLTLSLKAAVLVAAILFVRKLIGGRLSPAWRHALWGLVPLQLLFCISVPSPWSVQNLWTENEPVTVIPAKNDVTIPLSPYSGGGLGWGAEPLTDANTPHPPYFIDGALPGERGVPNIVTGASGFIAVWLVGVIVMALVFLRQTLLCRRWMREAELVENEDVLRLFKDCAKRMNVRTWLVIAESRSACGPLLIGAIRPTLLLPHGLINSATPRQLRTVFLHELAHLKRWDVWTGWLMTLLLTLHWFNPLLWLAVRKMNADREEAADELALRTMKTDERPDYGRALIDIAQHFVTPARTPGLVGISETGKNLTRRIEMLNQTETWKLRWKILALLAVLVLGVTTMTDAQTRSPAEIQTDIDRLKAELKEAKKAEKTSPRADIERLEAEAKETKKAPHADYMKDQLPGKYIGSEGDDRFGLEIGQPSGDVYPITMYEDGLPGAGHNPNDDDKYIGTATVFSYNPEIGKMRLDITVKQKFDGPKEKKVQFVMQPIRADIEMKSTENGYAMRIAIPPSGELKGISVLKNAPFAPLIPVPKATESEFGRYLGTEGDDRFGIIVDKSLEDGSFPITMFEDGLPGQGYDPNDDDRYEGTAVHKDGKLDIRLTKKFDGTVEEPVEKELRKLTATVGVEDGKPTISIPKNREWDAVKVTKEAPLSPWLDMQPVGTVPVSAVLPGSYLGWEGNDRIGLVLGESKDGIFPVTIYEDGLPGKGFNQNDDDRYEGTATFKDGKLEITLAKKFDENVEESVEKALRKLTATLGSENGKTTLSIPKNREWDAVKVTKVTE